MSELLRYNFTGFSLAPTTGVNVTGSLLINSSLAAMVPDSLGYATAPVLRVNPTVSATNLSSAISNNSYLNFSITPANGYELNLSGISFQIARGGAAGPRGWAIRSSLDNYATDLSSGVIPSQRTTFTPVSIPLPSPLFLYKSQSVTFRMYFYAPASVNTIELDDLVVQGTVETIRPFRIFIDGFDKTTCVKDRSFRRRDILNQQIDTADFTIRKTATHTYNPVVGHEVIVTRNSTRIFGGVILRVDESVDTANIINYLVHCVDYSQFLKRRLVTERYTNTTVGAIINDIITNYTDDGLTTTGVVGDQPIESFSFNRLTVADCLQKLADAVSHVWYVDYEKDIHFFPKNAETAPFDLTDTSNNYIYDSLEITADLSQIKNSILIQGGEQISDIPRTELISGDGARVQFALSNKYDSLPSITVGGVPQTVGVEYLGDDTAFDVMWNFNEKYIRFTTGNTPASGTNNISVTGTYLFPIVVRVPAPSSIAEYGLYEFAITDKSVRSQNEAIERALGELRVYQDTLFEGQFRTYNDGLRSGQVLRINSAQRGKDIDVLIQSVDTKMRDPLGTQLEYNVKFATLKSIGIIEYLQEQLRSKEVIVDDAETLLNFIQLEDTVTTSDTLAAPTFTVGPYVYSNDAGDTPSAALWDYSTWSA